MKRKLFVYLVCLSMIIPMIGCNMGDGETQKIPMNQGENLYQADDTYDAEAAKVATADFAVKLFQTYATTSASKENLLVSPISVYFALGMLENGAQGETLAELEETLGLNVGQMNSFAKEYMNHVPEELKLANSIWYTSHERFKVEDSFVQTVEGYFNADVYEAAFDDTTCEEINAWIDEKTDGIIKEALNEIPVDTVMYLINALVFEAEWEENYDEGQIHDAVFTIEDGIEQQVKMMYSEESYYLEDEKAKGFIKYYEGRDYAFVALLPNEEVGVYNYIQSLTGEYLLELLKNPTEVPVQVCIPQFKIEDEVELKDVLAEMGIQSVFDAEQSDLSGLGTSSAGNLFANRVIHKTYIEVSPTGTKAGAATIVEVNDECAVIYDEVKEVYLNRPFLYMIIDCSNNQPLFMGTVNYIDILRCGVSDDLCGYPTEGNFQE